LALANFMRLSLMKAAHAVISSTANRKSGGRGFPVKLVGVKSGGDAEDCA